MQRLLVIYVALSWAAFFAMMLANLGDPRLGDGLVHWNESLWYEKIIGVNAAIAMLLAVASILWAKLMPRGQH